MTKHAALVLLALLVLLWALARACAAPPAESAVGARVYVPIAQQGAPRCNRWRGDDWMPCVLATLTAEAQVSRTPRPTSMPTRASATWAPAPYEPLGRVWLPITADVIGPGRDCSAAWAGAAWYVAAHCLPRNPLLLRVAGATVTAWQSDAGGRDLAQVRAGDGGAPPLIARLEAADAVTLRPARGDVVGAWAGDVWARDADGGYEILPGPDPGARLVGVACVPAAAGRIGQGDSGGGVYRAGDGALGGIIIAAERVDDGMYDAWCGAEQSVLAERVP